MDMTSNRPYLIRAIYDWILDNGQTPLLMVDATNKGVVVPQAFVEDGHITFNIGPNAVHGLELDNDRIAFSARFKGVDMEVFLPPSAVLGIYPRENIRYGVVFPAEEALPEDGNAAEAEKPPTPSRGRPKLTVVK
jgi:stringent starvation protein B